jgi:Lon protease-like protein
MSHAEDALATVRRAPAASLSPEQTMDHPQDLSDFAGLCRLFPLPDLVLLPHALLPLHIFEPRYRQMTEDALADDRLVTMVQIRPAPEGTPWVEPVPIMEVGCLGRIAQCERLPDGRFNFLLLGCKRVRLIHEIDSVKLYRVAEAEILEDVNSSQPPEPRRGELIGLFRQDFEKQQRLNDDLQALSDSDVPHGPLARSVRRTWRELRALLNSAVPLGLLSDIIAHALGLPSDLKQDLLAEPNVDRRVAILRTILRQVAGEDQSTRTFPPPFSVN